MSDVKQQMTTILNNYKSNLSEQVNALDGALIEELSQDLLAAWQNKRQVFVCGNGGSGANANHIANDLIYGIGKTTGTGMRCHSLSANQAVMACLANDEGYDKIYSLQLQVLADPGDILIVLSGSGNSPNILDALDMAKKKGVKSWGLLGYSGGKASEMADRSLHFAIDDMQISEDLQMVVIHAISQHLFMLHKSGKHGI